MLKKIVHVALLAAALFAAPTFAADFQVGKHYTIVSEETTQEPVVMEFFSYGCPHCYTFVPFMSQLKSALGDKAEVQEIPVDFGGGYWTATQELYLVLQALGRLDELNMKAFEYIHGERKFISSSNAAKEFAARHGISKEDYEKAAKSFAAHVKKQRYDQLTKRYRISGTPTVIVNGKYKVELPSLSGGPSQFVELVNYLLANP